MGFTPNFGQDLGLVAKDNSPSVFEELGTMLIQTLVSGLFSLLEKLFMNFLTARIF